VNVSARPRLVLLGMMSKMPVAGVVWQTVHYLLGFQRLGYEVFYVEAHGCTPRCFIQTAVDDGNARAAAFIDGIMRRFDLADRWCYHPLYDDDRYFGMSDTQLRALYASADLIVNLHGGTEPLPEHVEHGRLVYLETDPVELQIELHENRPRTVEFLGPHCAFFTFGENLGAQDCKLPAPTSFEFKPTRQPVVMDLWKDQGQSPDNRLFTTIGNWWQPHRQVVFNGETYYWSKHFEFLKFVDLPALTPQRFELALSSYNDDDRAFLESKGWLVRSGLSLSENIDAYRDYISSSRGEYTVAKDQNVRFRTGWFSDRSAAYLAAGRPVITQETGFSNVLPVGNGLFGFSTMDELVRAIDRINSDYARHCRAAREIAREFFDSDVVLSDLLDHLGRTVSRAGRPAEHVFEAEDASSRAYLPLPKSLLLTPQARRPIKLRESTIRAVLRRRVPSSTEAASTRPRVSIVVVTFNNLVFNRLCLESILTNTACDYELIVVDNGSTDATPSYLRELAANNPRVRPFFNGHNTGFAAANNQGLAVARGEIFVLLNNDTIVPPSWANRLLPHLLDDKVGAVGAVTNRIGNEAEIEVECDTLGEFLHSAEQRALSHAGKSFPIRTLTMFCLALRRGVFAQVGPLDAGFDVGLLEDDDYSMRLHHAGYELQCAEDVLVYHFSQASFGELVSSGRYNELLERNKQRFKIKWGIPWQPYERRREESYECILSHVRDCVRRLTPHGAKVLVVSKGDDAVTVDGRDVWHFPQDGEGRFAGWYPADSAGAIGHLEILRDRGARFLVFPKPALWWLEYYREFRIHLEHQYRLVEREPDCVIFSLQKTKAS
jgi:GT2 family glycosyltransferase